jgi:hypothetical protein
MTMTGVGKKQLLDLNLKFCNFRLLQSRNVEDRVRQLIFMAKKQRMEDFDAARKEKNKQEISEWYKQQVSNFVAFSYTVTFYEAIYAQGGMGYGSNMYWMHFNWFAQLNDSK